MDPSLHPGFPGDGPGRADSPKELSGPNSLVEPAKVGWGKSRPCRFPTLHWLPLFPSSPLPTPTAYPHSLRAPAPARRPKEPYPPTTDAVC